MLIEIFRQTLGKKIIILRLFFIHELYIIYLLNKIYLLKERNKVLEF